MAAALSNDRDHAACVALFNKLHHERRELLVPATVVAEVGYLLAREAGAHLESLFLRSLAEGDFTPVELTAGDFSRMAELVENVRQPAAGHHRRFGDRRRGAPEPGRGGHP